MAIDDDVGLENKCEQELKLKNRNNRHRHNCVINALQRLIDYLYDNGFFSGI